MRFLPFCFLGNSFLTDFAIHWKINHLQLPCLREHYLIYFCSIFASWWPFFKGTHMPFWRSNSRHCMSRWTCSKFWSRSFETVAISRRQISVKMHPVYKCYLKSTTWTLQKFHRVERSRMLTALTENVHPCSMFGDITQFNMYFFIGNVTLIEISICEARNCPHGILISFRFLHRRQKHLDIHM